jgi:hypothetical protein
MQDGLFEFCGSVNMFILCCRYDSNATPSDSDEGSGDSDQEKNKKKKEKKEKKPKKPKTVVSFLGIINELGGTAVT